MMKIINLITTFLLFAQCAPKPEIKSAKTTMDAIEIQKVDGIANSPFRITCDRDLVLGNNHSGHSVVSLFIENDGELKGFNIRKLFIKDGKQNELINYHEINSELLDPDEYPEANTSNRTQ